MRLAVLSDLHIGKRMYRTEEGYLNKFEKAGYDAWNKNIDAILKYQPDMILYCGDIFDTANPSILALNQFKNGLKRLENIPSLMILGNHDFSFLNKFSHCSSLELVVKSFDNIKVMADYEVKTFVKDNHFFVLVPYVYTKQEEIDEIWNQCSIIADMNKDKHLILITHGVTEDYMNRFPEMADKFVVPDYLVRKFNEVFIGHIHTPFEYREEDTLVVSPGGLIDYQSYEVRTGPVFYDTKERILDRCLIETPHIHKLNCNKSNINHTFEKIGEHIYQIQYTGDPLAIDESLFIEAKKKAINIVIKLENEDNKEEAAQEELKSMSFIQWIAAHYQDKLDVFKEAQDEIREE